MAEFVSSRKTTLQFLFTSLFELTQFSGESWRPSTVGSLMSGTMVSEAGSIQANLEMIIMTKLMRFF